MSEGYFELDIGIMRRHSTSHSLDPNSIHVSKHCPTGPVLHLSGVEKKTRTGNAARKRA